MTLSKQVMVLNVLLHHSHDPDQVPLPLPLPTDVLVSGTAAITDTADHVAFRFLVRVVADISDELAARALPSHLGRVESFTKRCWTSNEGNGTDAHDATLSANPYSSSHGSGGGGRQENQAVAMLLRLAPNAAILQVPVSLLRISLQLTFINGSHSEALLPLCSVIGRTHSGEAEVVEVVEADMFACVNHAEALEVFTAQPRKPGSSSSSSLLRLESDGLRAAGGADFTVLDSYAVRSSELDTAHCPADLQDYSRCVVTTRYMHVAPLL